MSDKDLRAKERDLDEREQAIRLAEDELVEEETRLDSLEGHDDQHNATIDNLLLLLKEQEESLRRRAEMMGPEAVEHVARSLDATGLDSVDAMGSGSGDDERAILVERREELLATRMAILEDRQAALANRQMQIEEASEQLETVRNRLLDYEQTLADTLRSLIRSSANWDSPGPSTQPRSSSRSNADNSSRAPSSKAIDETPDEPSSQSAPSSASSAPESPPKRKKDDFKITFVDADEVEQPEPEPEPESNPDDATVQFHSPHSPAEDQATSGRSDVAVDDDGEFPITLEIDMLNEDGHAFFQYEDDDPDELPGLFLSTNRRLKEGREVSLELLVTSEGTISTNGVVSWTQSEEDEDGPSGMGIDIVDLTPADMAFVRIWLESHKMMIV